MPSKDLPIGIVTFLFTDIEGHTRILERLGERYRAIKERHDATVRSAIAAGEGREVSTEGDSFFAMFPTPTGAVRAAATIQRGPGATAWPDGAIVRVRIELGHEVLDVLAESRRPQAHIPPPKQRAHPRSALHGQPPTGVTKNDRV